MNTALDSRPARRAFQLGVANGVLFTLAERLMDPTLVVAAFVSYLSDSPIWLGLVLPITEGGWYLPQFWLSGRVQAHPRKIVLYRQVAVVRGMVWALMVLSVFTIRDRTWLLVAFMSAFAITSLLAGFAGLSFLEVVGKTVPPRMRGQFFAWRLALGGVGSLAAAVLVRWLVNDTGPLAFPYNFGVLFAISLALAVAGLAAFAAVREPADARPPAPTAMRAQTRRALQVVRTNANFRRFLLLRIMLLAAGAAPPFFAIYVQQRLGGSLAMVGVYLATFTIANLAAHVVFGRYSERMGNRRTMLAAAWAGLLMTAAVAILAVAAEPAGISGALASAWLVPVFALYGIRESGIGVASHSLLLDLAPPAERTLYLGFTNSLLGVVLLATALSGVVVAVFGFTTLVLAALAAHVAALLAARHMHETALA